jgi:hypothetical protein
MSRPTRLPIVNGQQAWDSLVNDDFKNVFNRPLAICIQKADESTTLTETTLASEYAAASYQDCIAWVNHTVRGKTLYRSNGTTWEIVRGATKFYERSIAALATVQDYDDVIVCTGTTYTVTLPAASGNSGRVLYIKRNSSGTITIDGNASEQIDGSLTLALSSTLAAALLICDGSNWFTFGGSGASGLLVIESISGVGTIGATTTLAICSGTTYTVTLPAAATAGAGFALYVKRTSSGNITIDGNASETIDGALTLVLRNTLQGVRLVSDGSNWSAVSEAQPRKVATVTESLSGVGTIGDFTETVIASGTTYTLTLPAAATYGAGRILEVKRTASGNITLDGNASETIDGGLTYVLRHSFESARLYCDGSNWHVLADAQARPPALVAEALSGVGTIGDNTEIVVASGTTYTLTLPAAATYGANRILIVKRTSSGNITLDGNASETIDGSLTFVLDVALMSATLHCDGSNWNIV